MENIEFLGLEIEIFGEIGVHDINLGAITFYCDGREYKLDVIRSNFVTYKNSTYISSYVGENREFFNDCKYDLTEDDIIRNPYLKCEICVDAEYNVVVDDITLFIRYNELTTKAIKVTIKN